MQPTKPLLVLAALAFATEIVAAQHHEQMQMEKQPGADQMKVSVRSPADGAKITGDNVTLQVATSGFKNGCDLARIRPDQPLCRRSRTVSK